MKKNNKKTIWIFHPDATFPDMGGLTRAYDFAKHLISKGYKTTIFSSAFLHHSGYSVIHDGSRYLKVVNNAVPIVFIKNIAYKNSKFLRVSNMVYYFLSLLIIANKYAKLHGPPDVIIGSSPHPFALIAAICISKKYKCQSIAEIRDLWPESFVAFKLIKGNNPILRLLYKSEKWIYKKANKIIFTMEGGKDYIVEKCWDKEQGGPINLSKVYHVNNGVDLEEFDYNKEHYTLEDSDLKESDTFKVIYTGSIRFANQVDKIIDVARILADQNVKFLVWGDGDQLERLRKRIKDEQINNVCFKGRVNKKYVPYITANAQLNVMFYKNMSLFRFGGSMNKLFDYFASGKPILLSFKTGYSLIERYKAGIELDDSSTEMIAEKIVYFKNLDKTTYNEYCRNARRAAEDYSFKNLTSSLIDVINRTN